MAIYLPLTNPSFDVDVVGGITYKVPQFWKGTPPVANTSGPVILPSGNWSYNSTDGTNFLALQGSGTYVEQTFATLPGQAYLLVASCAARASDSNWATMTVRVNGQVVMGPFTPLKSNNVWGTISAPVWSASGYVTLRFENSAAAGSGNCSVLLDYVRWTAYTPGPLANPGFDADSPGNFTYTIPSGWCTCTVGGGGKMGPVIIPTGNAVWGVYYATSGGYYLALQGQNTYVEQMVATVPGTTYQLALSCASRSTDLDLTPPHQFTVWLDGSALLGPIFPIKSGTTWETRTVTFTATTSHHVLRFQNTSSFVGDCSILIDSIVITAV